MNILAIVPWPYRILALALLCAAIWAHGWLRGARHGEAKLAAFEAAVRAEGGAAQKLADARILAERTRKVESDERYKTARADLRATADRLRVERATRDILPAAATNSGSPDRACFDRAQLERALRGFVVGTAGLAAEGDEIALRLKMAVEWAR